MYHEKKNILFVKMLGGSVQTRHAMFKNAHAIPYVYAFHYNDAEKYTSLRIYIE